MLYRWSKCQVLAFHSFTINDNVFLQLGRSSTGRRRMQLIFSKGKNKGGARKVNNALVGCLCCRNVGYFTFAALIGGLATV